MTVDLFRLRILVISVVAIVCSCPAVWAVDDAQPADTQIGQLESRLFEHRYDGESSGGRLARLEKMVFGESRDGTESQRLSALEAALADSQPVGQSTADSAVATAAPAASQQTPDHSDESASSGSAPDQNEKASAESEAADYQNTGNDSVSDSNDYPRITALENQILGATYKDLPVTKRLEQLETKAFGKPSHQADLSARTDKLEKYVRNHMHLRTLGDQVQPQLEEPAEGSAETTMPTVQAAATEPPLEAPLTVKLDWMERVVFGRQYEQEGAVVRVERLEKALFPQEDNSSQATLEDQISMLMGAVELMQNGGQTTAYPGAAYQYESGPIPEAYPNGAYQPEPSYPQQFSAADQQTDKQQTTNAPKKHPLLKSIAHVLGEVGGMALGAVGNSGLMYGSPYGYGYGYGGFGMPGMWW